VPFNAPGVHGNSLPALTGYTVDGRFAKPGSGNYHQGIKAISEKSQGTASIPGFMKLTDPKQLVCLAGRI